VRISSAICAPLAGIALSVLSAVPFTGAAPAGEAGSSRYIVVLNGIGDTRALATSAGVTIEAIFASALDAFVATMPPSKVEALRHDPRVAYVAPDRPVRLLDESTPTGVWRIGASSRVAAGQPDGPRSAVAIVDTGVAAHPELNVAGGVSCNENPIGDQLAGVMGKGEFRDDNGHGSHVSGTVAARADGRGVVGVSPGSPLYAVRVLNALGSGSVSNVICGLDWVAAKAAEKNIKVVNMSLGARGGDDGACGTKAEDPLHAAVCRVVQKGVTVVVAAGNDNEDLRGSVPAAYNEVLTVTAMADYDGLPGSRSAPGCGAADRDDTAAGFSNFATGDDVLHTVAAPGVCINSTWNDGGYRAISGTSMASPHVAGLVARCIDAGPCSGLPPAEITGRIRALAAARPAGTGFYGDPRMSFPSRYYGYLVDGSTF
jgi:subtilisin